MAQVAEPPEMPEPQGSSVRRRGRPPAGAREAILAAASELISEGGLSDLTTREVARRAGVSEASVFYHFQDKAGLLEQVVLTGLEPLKEQDVAASEAPDQPLEETLLQLSTALEGFFDHAMPVLSAVQADASLRQAFTERLVKGDLGPHRGVRLLSQHLTTMAERGLADSQTDTEAVAMLLIGACFLRSWQRQLSGAGRDSALPGLPGVVSALARLLTPG